MKHLLLYSSATVIFFYILIGINSCSLGQSSSSSSTNNTDSHSSVFVQPVFTLIGSWTGPNEEFINSVYVDVDNTIYATAKYDGLFILTNPGPLKAGKFQTNYYPMNDIVVKSIGAKKYAYIALGVYNGRSGVIVLDVSSPTNILMTNFIDSTTLNCNALLDFIGASGTPLYTADDYLGFQRYNFNFAAATAALGTAMDRPFQTVDIALSSDNNYAFLAAKNKGVFIVDIATGTRIFQINNYPISSIQAVSVSGNNLAAADELSGILIYNVASASYPKLMTVYATSGSALDVVMNGNDIYIADGSNGILKIRWTPPSTFSLDRVYQDGAVYYKLFYSSSTGYLYAACGKSGIRVLQEIN